MTIEQAAEFFHQWGNVGRSPEDLLTKAPTAAQIMEATMVAQQAFRAKLMEASEVIARHYAAHPSDDTKQTRGALRLAPDPEIGPEDFKCPNDRTLLIPSGGYSFICEKCGYLLDLDEA